MTEQQDRADSRALHDARAHLAATREILDVMAQSRDDEAPVFRAILERAERLCDAQGSGLQLLNPAGTHLVIAAIGGKDWDGSFPVDTAFALDEPAAMCVAVREARVVHIEDMRETEEYRQGQPKRRKFVDEDGVLAHLCVPLLRDGVAFGNITLSRREPRPFSREEIALVQTFAEQAVIAIENVRQFREVQMRLARERASSEILGVISESREDQGPVFDAILRNACALCNAPLAGLILGSARDATQTLAAHVGMFPEAIELFRSGRMKMEADLSYAARSIIEGRLIAFDDMGQSELYAAGSPVVRSMVDSSNIRSVLFVPLMRDGTAIGNLTLFRREVRAFDPSEIALVETFAEQAVIAIENVRQFREVQSRLEREAAAREVLGVISRSRDDEMPVFEAILENASRLCNAPLAFLPMANDARTHVSVPAFRGVKPDFAQVLKEFNEPMEGSGLVAVRAVAEARIIQSADLVNDPEFPASGRWRDELVETEGARSVLLVPLMQGDVAIGAIMLYRREIAPFGPDDVQLVSTFAEQAVIAIENVRQFRALEALNAELGARVEKQVGEIERMGRLKRFLPAAVADTVVSQGSDNLLKSHRALLGVLFCDIRGFTAFCETAEPEETIEVLQSYHEEMGALIAAHGAGVDTRAGDGIMVLFNDPLPCDDPAGDALRLGLAMRARMSELSRKWRRHGHRLGFGVGISLGYATVGMVGSAGRYDYTASGTAVNLAARLCDQAQDGEILLSPRAHTAVEKDFAAVSVGELSLKGIHAPVEVFRVVTED